MLPIHRVHQAALRRIMLLLCLVFALVATACREESGASSVDEIVDRVVVAPPEEDLVAFAELLR